MLVAQVAQQRQVGGARQDDAHVAGDRLDDQRRDVVAVLLERGAHGVEIVERHDHACRRRRPAGTPPEPGIPSVTTPEPALASSMSAWPW